MYLPVNCTSYHATAVHVALLLDQVRDVGCNCIDVENCHCTSAKNCGLLFDRKTLIEGGAFTELVLAVT